MASPPSAPKYLILLLGDDESARISLVYNLVAAGYEVFQAAGAAQALDRARTVDLVVLDLAAPDLPGEEVCRLLRHQSNVPILIISGRRSQAEKVKGFALGADDYVTKPFGAREVLARVDALIRRSKRPPHLPVTPDPIRLGDFVLDAGARRVTVSDREVTLSRLEFSLLLFLLQHPGEAHSVDALLRMVWGPDFHGQRKTVTIHIMWLRRKFEVFAKIPFRICTVPGAGYRVDLAPGRTNET